MVDVDEREPQLKSLICIEEPLRKVVDGFLFTEGPVWHPVERHLTFSDIPASRIYRWSAEAGLSTLRDPSNKTNGNAYDRQGRLISCEHVTSRLIRVEPDGSRTTLADSYRGLELNSPNDVIVSIDGTIYFTDPLYGRVLESMGSIREPQLTVNGVYRLGERAAELTLLIDDLEGPNGLCLSLDEDFLFVNDSERGHIRRFALKNGRAVGGEIWAQPAGPGEGGVDGMKIDSAGNLYCTGPGGVFVYDADARCLGVIQVREPVGNFTWGDDDLQTLYLCSTTSVFSCRTRVPGPPAF